MTLELKLGSFLVWMTVALIAIVAFKLVVLIPSSSGLLSNFSTLRRFRVH